MPCAFRSSSLGAHAIRLSRPACSRRVAGLAPVCFQSTEQLQETPVLNDATQGAAAALPAVSSSNSSDHQSQRIQAIPAVAHHARCHTPLQAPIVQPSHTSISIPLGSIDLYGNYSVQGPAVIRKINNALVALVQPGGVVSVPCSTEGPMLMSSASLSHDDDEAALCHLMGQHLELDGAFEFHGSEDGGQQGIRHDGKTIVSLRSLPDDACITLMPGGSVSHPVNVHPQPH